jgi:N-acylglucosamine 2-epimerase
MEPTALLDLYRRTLVDDVVPWWICHGIDPDGPINSCIGDDGQLINRDRWNWSQWRAVWVFSKLYNSIEARPQWLEVAQGIYKFAAAHGPLEDGHWPLLLDGNGTVQNGYSSLYVDGFALYGLTELYRATRDPEVLALARGTFEAAERALHHRLPPPTFPYPIPEGRINHGISMIFSLAYYELAEATGDREAQAAAQSHHHRVMNQFLRADRDLVLEWIAHDGAELPSPEGTACVPGHAIESMWFQIHIARSSGDRAMIDRAVKTIRTHLERGWDEEYGGLLLAIDADGGDEVGWPHAETKLWWPHTEALYATLLAHEMCGEPWCLEWHERIREYSFAHYPVQEHGEWRQKLDRQGQPLTETICLPVKDPFHLPRALIYCVESLERITTNQQSGA